MRRISLIPIGIVLLLLHACGHDNEPIREAVLNSINQVGKLELVEQRSEEVILISGSGESLSTIGSLEDTMTYLDDLLRVGHRVGVYSFSHLAIAYIDLTDLSLDDVTIDSDDRITINLPTIHVEPIGRSGEIRLLHERVTGTKRPITAEERTKVQDEASRQARERLLPGTPNHTALVRQAQEQAIAYFTGLLRSRGYEDVTIHFNAQSNE